VRADVSSECEESAGERQDVEVVVHRRVQKCVSRLISAQAARAR
jgi:hypothetical protein